MSAATASPDPESSETLVFVPWLCGTTEPAWNSSASWNTPDPSLSQCVRKIVWTLPPYLVMSVLLPFQARAVLSAKWPRQAATWKWVAHFLVTAAIVALAAIDFVDAAANSKVGF
jgi:hypothetical protein